MSEETLHSVVLDLPERQHDAKFEAERQAFWNQYPELLQQYSGRYVAIHQGRVIDSDEDERKLIRRVYETVGYIPVYIQRVSPEGIPRYRMSSPRIRRP